MYQQEHISSAASYAPIEQTVSCSAKRIVSKKIEKTSANKETATKQHESTTCQGGVCLVTWKPQRPAA
jgi:hypothetical protein